MSTGGNLKKDDGTPGFSVYLHWPFCAAKCPYCDFNSHVRREPPDQARYAAAFASEIAHVAVMQPNREITSIFFGGGTPSLMKPETVGSVLDAIAKYWHVPDGIEITLEANPTSIEAKNFRGYREAGVNRVSMGVQSLDDEQLKFLGRLHTADDARKAISLARKTFPRMSFDLIYARPKQTAEAWENELNKAIDLAADHLSLYQLTIEQGTPFHALRESGKLKTLDSEQAAQLYEITQKITAMRGLPAYEISNHAVPGAESRHNLTYWRYGAYVGIGPGAHGRLDLNDGRHATRAEANPERWLELVEAKGNGLVEDEVLTLEEAGDEMLLMGLRLREGIDRARFAEIAGHDVEQVRLDELKGYGLIETLPNGRLRATSEGWLVLDAVIADLAA